jgi:hypothetical protein
MNDILLRLTEKTKKKFIYEAFEPCDTCMVSFDLWMSRGMDTFVLITHLLNHNWEFGHVTIGLFETIEIFRATMAIHVNEMLVAYGFNIKILAYVKDEGNNLCTITTILTSIIS